MLQWLVTERARNQWKRFREMLDDAKARGSFHSSRDLAVSDVFFYLLLLSTSCFFY